MGLCQLPRGGPGFCPLVGELVLVPLPSRAVSRCVFIRQLWAQDDQAACLLMSGAVLPPCWLFGLRHLRPNSTEACGLWGGASSWWASGGLLESSCQQYPPRLLPPGSLPLQWATATSTGVPSIPASRSDLGSYKVTAFAPGSCRIQNLVYPLRVEFLFPPLPGNSCYQILPTFKTRCSGTSTS